MRNLVVITAASLGMLMGSSFSAERAAAAPSTPAQTRSPAHSTAQMDRGALDRSGERKVGTASFYAEPYVGRKMADGTRMKRDGDNAASLTLPLGTVAKVTNLASGRTEVVTIRDRGPYVKGRIIDLSPGTASRLGIDRRQGLARVAVAPIAVPTIDGRFKPGDGALEDSGLVRLSRLESSSGTRVE